MDCETEVKRGERREQLFVRAVGDDVAVNPLIVDKWSRETRDGEDVVNLMSDKQHAATLSITESELRVGAAYSTVKIALPDAFVAEIVDALEEELDGQTIASR